MTRRVGLRDVAALARTSTKTASRVVNRDPRVRADTRARVEQAVHELRYRPDPLARSLRRGTDETIGVVVDEVSDPFFASVIGEIERMSLDRGVTVIVASTRRLADRESIVVDGLLQRRVAGLILASIRDDHSSLRSAPCPVVFIDRAPVGLTADAILADDRSGAVRVVEHLLAHGHRRIAYAGDRLGIDTARLREGGYFQALADAGIPAREEYVRRMDPELADGRAVVEELLALEEPPTAIFSANTRCSLRLLPALHRMGRTDVAFVSFGDFPTAQALTPPVTVVNHSPVLIGRLAAERLFLRLDGNEIAPETIVARVELIPRGSGEVAT